MLETLITHVRDRIQAGFYTELVDAYCGIGVFALLTGEKIDRIEGIESDAAAVTAARENARYLNLPRAVFHRGATETLIGKVLSKIAADRACVLLDPPRAGCPGPVLQALITHKSRGIIYVSCAPPILARDLKLLVGAGYRLCGVRPFDMFPQTAHCEVVAELQR